MIVSLAISKNGGGAKEKKTKINLAHPPKKMPGKIYFLNNSNNFFYNLIVSKFSLFPLFHFCQN
jgi:hypothetical protein